MSNGSGRSGKAAGKGGRLEKGEPAEIKPPRKRERHSSPHMSSFTALPSVHV